jgi:hypothetical protein
MKNKIRNKIHKKTKELLDLCILHDKICYLSIEGGSEDGASYNTVGELKDVHGRVHGLIDQLNRDLKSDSNDCIRIAYKDIDDKWIIKQSITHPLKDMCVFPSKKYE